MEVHLTLLQSAKPVQTKTEKSIILDTNRVQKEEMMPGTWIDDEEVLRDVDKESFGKRDEERMKWMSVETYGYLEEEQPEE